ncbi:hypothetical protein B0H11DRAFT_2266000 [Mycena galericulata]|nr:hypothetical protein B0H11DRAFT_2266000 [Mycena galericulata]
MPKRDNPAPASPFAPLAPVPSVHTGACVCVTRVLRRTCSPAFPPQCEPAIGGGHVRVPAALRPRPRAAALVLDFHAMRARSRPASVARPPPARRAFPACACRTCAPFPAAPRPRQRACGARA